MRALAAALALLLLVAICSLAEADLRDSSIATPSQKQETIPTACCFSYTSRRIPLRAIRSAYMTSNSCQMPAMVLVTKRGKEICTDPAAHWVQEYMKQLELLEH